MGRLNRRAIAIGMRASALTTAMLLSASRIALAQDAPVNILDTIVITPTRIEEAAVDTLSSTSVVGQETLQRINPDRLSDAFEGMPNVWINQNRDDMATGFNVRGLQDYGRVAVTVDGARQNYQQSSHGPQGQVFVDPALIGLIDVTRGPVANTYGSGAIGGVVSISTKEASDILRPGESFATQATGGLNINGMSPEFGGFIAMRPDDRFDVLFGLNRRQNNDYRDGNGNLVANTGHDATSWLGKTTFRPADGHRIQLGTTGVHGEFDSGQPGSPFNPMDGPVYGNVVDTMTNSLSYGFQSPDTPLIDFNASAYWVKTDQRLTVKEALGICSPFPAFCFTGPVGTTSRFVVNTLGSDVHNTSRFAGLGLDHTVTLGGDVFSDSVDSSGVNYGPDSGFLLTPDGQRSVYGGYVQWLAERSTWLDVIVAARYDAFQLNGGGTSNSGSRLSPKATVAVTPWNWMTVYATYAEGYRAPAVSEALVAGFHPGMIFQFIPNPSLRPEIGRTIEAGTNFSFDNVLREGDSLRIKANVFTNNVTDYIDLADRSAEPVCVYPMGCFGYVNIAQARLSGVEAQASYDAGGWFALLNGSLINGVDAATGTRLASVPPASFGGTLGARFFDRKLTLGTTVQHVTGGIVNPSTTLNADPYTLVGLFASYEPVEDVVATLAVDNLLNTQYTRYLENLPSPGISVKGGLRIRFGGS